MGAGTGTKQTGDTRAKTRQKRRLGSSVSQAVRSPEPKHQEGGQRSMWLQQRKLGGWGGGAARATEEPGIWVEGNQATGRGKS